MELVLQKGTYKLWVYASDSNFGYVTNLSTGSYEADTGPQVKVKIGSAWKDLVGLKIKTSSGWVDVIRLFTKQSSGWKEV